MSEKIILNENEVDELFAIATSSADVVLALYKKVVPDWDKVKKVGWPKINETTNKMLFQKFIHFDKIHCPECVAGGRWLNNGFSSVGSPKDLKDWEVTMEGVEVEY